MSDHSLIFDSPPTEWRPSKFGEICSRVQESVSPCINGKRLYLGLEHLAAGFPALIGQGKESDVRSGKTAFRKGDILFGKLRPYLRKSVMVDADGISSTDILVFRAGDNCLAEFLCFLTHTDEFINHAKATTSGVQHPRTSWAALREFALYLPPLTEQRKIAAVLGLLQRAIEQQERLIGLTTELKKALLHKLFTEGLRGEPQKQTEIGPVPESWEIVSLDEVAAIERGKFAHRPRNHPRFYGGSTPFVQTGDVSNCDGKIRTFSQTLNEEGVGISKIFPSGTILITIAANIGFSGILEFDSACPDSLIGLTPNHRISAEFLQYYLSTQQPEMDRLAPRGTQKNINIQFLKPWRIRLPPTDEQDEIVKCLGAVDEKLRSAAQKRGTLDDLFRTLLHQLMTARIRVHELNLDEIVVGDDVEAA
jgi:type I restriction enzyme S subunit